ncbi:MAG: AAA family ATPase [Candidatus Bathyarchaeota archaeon]|nr:AAA family ATPase [Candidatus Bathyarchaeota archaeon]
MMNRSRLLLITGMAGSGKTTLANILTEKGYKVFTMGDVIRHEIRMRNLPATPENIGKMASDIRKTGGDAAVAKKCIPLIIGEPNNSVALDGVRSLDEVYTFEEAFDVYIVVVHASPETRFKRLKNRGRSDDPPNRQAFRARDHRELGFGMGNAIALSDYIITNENGIDELEKSLEKLLLKLRSLDGYTD